jgi:hypothetical protein
VLAPSEATSSAVSSDEVGPLKVQRQGEPCQG